MVVVIVVCWWWWSYLLYVLELELELVCYVVMLNVVKADE